MKYTPNHIRSPSVLGVEITRFCPILRAATLFLNNYFHEI